MKLVNINKNGTQKFQLKDGRFIYSYNSGYVRIDSGLDRLYQINKVKKYNFTDFHYYYERVLIPCPSERFQFIVDWVNKNVKDIPYTLTRQLRQKTNYINYFKNKYGNY